MDKVLLHIEHLTKRYDKDTVALRDVSIDFKEGDFVVVIGPSGAGNKRGQRAKTAGAPLRNRNGIPEL